LSTLELPFFPDDCHTLAPRCTSVTSSAGINQKSKTPQLIAMSCYVGYTHFSQTFPMPYSSGRR
jgi:hypothetical protein